MFTRRFTLLLTAALIGAALPRAVAAPADGEILMASWPCLSPDGKTLVFEWRDDLWSVPAAGGLAERLTAHPARDSFPTYSPDGKVFQIEYATKAVDNSGCGARCSLRARRRQRSACLTPQPY